MKLWLTKVGKSDACIRPLFVNSVTVIAILPTSLQKIYCTDGLIISNIIVTCILLNPKALHGIIAGAWIMAGSLEHVLFTTSLSVVLKASLVLSKITGSYA